MAQNIYLIPLLPLLGFTILGLVGSRIKNEKIIGTIGTAAIFIPFLVAVSIFLGMVYLPVEERGQTVSLFTWIATGQFHVELAYRVDQLSILFTMIITGIGSLIHLYSIGYMHGDKSFYRFFAYLNLFIFMMLNLVLAENFLVTFLGWEGVGLASYLLIGFWYDRKFDGFNITWTGDAAKKAFIVNRIGDFGMLAAMFILYYYFGTLSYDKINIGVASTFHSGDTIVTVVALLLFLGCTGKSAQIPLFVWLPDAMAGPTPVSALIHAATMVTSGLFLIARNATIFSLSPVAMQTVAIIGVATAFIAGTVGIVQNDIKKVLAYSTVSQLGFMFLAMGVGAFTAGIFHVMTHAFFKACLFLGSGSVIHGMHEEQDIQKMGGLRKYMPITYWTFFLATLAIAGIFPFSGFFSKDEILWQAFSSHVGGSPVLWGIGVLAAFTTAFYMYRLVNLTFNGKERFDHHHVHPHESPLTMTIPLMVLATLSVLGGFLGVPHSLGHSLHIPNLLEHWLDPIFEPANHILHITPPTEIHVIEYVLMGASLLLAVAGLSIAAGLYGKESETPNKVQQQFSGLYNLLWNKYFVDNAYYSTVVNPLWAASKAFLWKIVDVLIIDGIVNGSAKLMGTISEFLRKSQSGIAQNYAVVMVLGIALVFVVIVFG